VYRIDKAGTDVPNITLSSVASQITVTVKSIPPGAGNTTPSCDADATNNKEGTNVTLRQVGSTAARTQPTTASSTTVFTGLTDFASYTASAVAPPGYEVCPPSTSAALLMMPGSNGQITLKIRPLCGSVVVTPPPYDHYTAPYNHYSDPYHHYSAPYAHYGPYYNTYSCSTNKDGTQTCYWSGMAQDYLGTWADYYGYYGDYLGYYGDFLSNYSDAPVVTATCPS
jgi:hypothetical protein